MADKAYRRHTHSCGSWVFHCWEEEDRHGNDRKQDGNKVSHPSHYRRELERSVFWKDSCGTSVVEQKHRWKRKGDYLEDDGHTDNRVES